MKNIKNLSKILKKVYIETNWWKKIIIGEEDMDDEVKKNNSINI